MTALKHSVIVLAVVWSLSGAALGWQIGRWIGIWKFGGYYGRAETLLGHVYIVYPGIAAIIGALLDWFFGTVLNTWPKTRGTWFQVGCWTAILWITLLLALFGPVVPARE